jgi:hypothetical protein
MGFELHGMQITHWLPKMGDCIFWYSWFKERKIPVAIIKCDGSFAVFRKGKVIRKSDKGGFRVVEPIMKINGNIFTVESCNGY